MRLSRWISCLFLASAAANEGGARADLYIETDLASSVPGLAAHTDASLQNPWGMSFGPNGPYWVSNQVAGNSTLYNAAGVPLGLIVSIPPAGGGGNPTGQVFNATASDFKIGGAKPIFIFDSLNGTLSGWTGGAGNTAAVTAVTVSGASYTGLTLGNNGTGNLLYAANDGQGRIDVFDTNYANPAAFNGKFVDPTLPAGFTPYNIQNLGGKLYVAYEGGSGADGGVVDVFDLNGKFLQRIAANGPGGVLSHPWGMTIAPTGFGQFANDLLVGNEGTGKIDAFDPTTGSFLGSLQVVGASGASNIGFGLWALTPASNGDPTKVFFTAGLNGETQGLFGSLSPAAVPEPGVVTLFGLGGTLYLVFRRVVSRCRVGERVTPPDPR